MKNSIAKDSMQAFDSVSHLHVITKHTAFF